MEFAFLGRQPIMTGTGDVGLYSLLFRKDNAQKIKDKDSSAVYGSVISHLLEGIGLKETLLGKKGMIKVNDQIIIKTDLTLLPKDQVIFELTSQTNFSHKVSEKIENLVGLGYEFALTHTLIDAVIEKRNEEFLQYFHYIIFNVRRLDFDIFHKHEHLFKSYQSQLIATKVETQQGFEMCKRLGFHYFQGHFFEEPIIIKGKKLASDKITLMQILVQFQDGDEMDDIIKSIKYAPDLSILLLKYINTAELSRGKDINTIERAVSLLGRDKLKSWIMLSLFTAKGEKNNPLLIETTLMRAKLMELLCDVVRRSDYRHLAYTVGLLSLSDAIFKVSMRKIMQESHFSDAIKSALVEGEGELGKILKLAIIIERGNFKQIELVSRKLNISLEKLTQMFKESFAYINEVKKVLK